MYANSAEGGNPDIFKSSPAKKRRAIQQLQEERGHSERRICRVLNQPRSTQRDRPQLREAAQGLRERITELACQYGRYGYRRITALLRHDGWKVNHKRVERIWREEGLKVPKKHPKRRRLWWNDGSCLRLRPQYKDHVWSYDFVAERTSDGRALRILNVIDEYTRECLAIRIGKKLTANDVIDTLADICMRRGTPHFIRSDDGPEFVAQLVRDGLKEYNRHLSSLGALGKTDILNRSTESSEMSYLKGLEEGLSKVRLLRPGSGE